MSCCAKTDLKTTSGGGCCGPKTIPDGGVHENVQNFYANEATKKTNKLSDLVCDFETECHVDISDNTSLIHEAMDRINKEVRQGTFGCGVPFPPDLKGCRVLDLGSGMGRDCYAVSYLVGADGFVVGVDMTPTMLDVAKSYIPWHKSAFGYSNVDFKHGYLEKLDEVTGLGKDSFDVIISNCVINLCTDKRKVFQDAFNLLKPGGELFFSDIYVNKTISEEAQKHELAYNACFSGALVWDEFVSMTREIGFHGPFTTKDFTVKEFEGELKDVLAGLTFWSRNCRLVKLADKEVKSTGDDAKHSVTYRGTMDKEMAKFMFSEDVVFQAKEAKDVSTEVHNCLKAMRYGKHFDL